MLKYNYEIPQICCLPITKKNYTAFYKISGRDRSIRNASKAGIDV